MVFVGAMDLVAVAWPVGVDGVLVVRCVAVLVAGSDVGVDVTYLHVGTGV